MSNEPRVRHILSLSGGKDSAALAIYMRDRVPEMEYIFSDTGKELPETYDYLQRLENYLGKPLHRLNADLGFDHWYTMYGGMIPSNHRRWCTKMLKLKPFEDHCGNDQVINYVGLRADENRSGYISHKTNIKAVYPFQQDGLILRDIEEILRTSGVGMPPYTKWGRTRSGCFFCFYQQKIEWVRLKETHPDLYEKAKEYEVPFEKTGNFFTWSQGESLAELEKPERMAQIKRDHALRVERMAQRKDNSTLIAVFSDHDSTETPDEDDDQGCLVCSL
ncbi:phosphoadenosine phosphosulfate reductase family protein [Pseudomonas aeruginosa]|uniref:phosphoadenosine phosphosulfate reductase family protein n=3 Tax=Pseudomonas aeruginosa TaxID=287 RepID=UPI000B40CBEF|nr:phosphoadenosine phosphosulfate reductase family protein [Pseudomonas aeruginosa]EKT7991619.1 phosphoadenosine phosphosulfate reductase family protein [Pseudomonas aeruginosa]EKX5232117.1 phosphoadenosine phosphosulfate reductase family protein [Pseudomonas aeruginosa]ELJ3070520.1 phosphoadenosine phosphosulfate reductase family protein [Pseudomonas aeruginosa]MBG3895645.1 phosphoadenosine phosphosulfate reductase family protein [Pseudomonas aeruginosa]MDO5907585.1 phosphoadenosine phosphos